MFYLACLIFSSILEVKSETPSTPTPQVPLNREESRQLNQSISFMQGSIQNHLISLCVTDKLSARRPPTPQVARADCQQIYDESTSHADTCQPYRYVDDVELASYINQRSLEISARKELLRTFLIKEIFVFYATTRKASTRIDLESLGQKFVDLNSEITRRQQCLFSKKLMRS